MTSSHMLLERGGCNGVLLHPSIQQEAQCLLAATDSSSDTTIQNSSVVYHTKE